MSLSDEDEVKVHAAGDIEEGELSSGEEGEIKDTGRVLSDPTHQSGSPAAGEEPVERPEREMAAEESGDSEEEEEEEEEETVATDKRKVERPRSSAMRSNRVCRHFLQGKCSWGRECRFSHDDEALPGRPHPPPPYGARERLLEPHLVGPLEPGFMRLPPPGPGVLLPPPPLPPRDGAPLFLPYNEHRAGVAQVEEESDGWYRLRTVARHWSSDEDEKKQKVSRSRKKERESSEDSEQEKGSTKRESSETSSSGKIEVKSGKKKKKKKRDCSPVDSKTRLKRRVKGGSDQQKKSSSSESSEGELSHHHTSYHYLPRPHFFQHNDPFPPFGPPGFLPPPPHGPIPFGAPPIPPVGHYSDHFGPPPYPEWHRGPRVPHRDHSLSPKRRRRQRKTSSSSPNSSPEHHSRREEGGAMDRKEQLLQELNVINKVIERKKQKRNSRKSE